VVGEATKDGSQPDAVGAERGDIVHLFGDAPEGAAAKAAQVGRLEPVAALPRVKAVDKDLIDDRAAGPGGRRQAVDAVGKGPAAGGVAGRGGVGQRLAAEKGAGGLLGRQVDVGPVGPDLAPASQALIR
jgi:hypothetical protein